MRIRVAVVTRAREIPWDEVQRPGRGLLYDLMREAAPDLGEQLHHSGLDPYGMVPFGYGSPVFPGAGRVRGIYAAGGAGTWEFGSPMPAVVEAFANGIASRTLLDWGGTALRVQRIDLIEPPEFGTGRATFRTTTPVVMKGSGRDEHGVRTTRQAWLLPRDPEFPGYFTQNLRRKGATLGLGEEVQLDAITAVGPKRSFAVKDGKKVGATVQVELSGDPALLRAIWAFGLGQNNAAGFGWVAG